MPEQSQPIKLKLSAFRADVLGVQKHILETNHHQARYTIGGHESVILSRVDDIRHVLIGAGKNYKRARQHQNLGLTIGNGLISSDGEQWQRERAKMQPVFDQELLTSVAEYTSAYTAAALQDLQTTANNGETIDIYPLLQQITMRVIGKLLFSRDVAEIQALFSQIGRHALTFAMFRNFIPIELPLWIPIPIHLKHQRLMKQLNTLMDAQIDERLANPTKYTDILARLLLNYGDDVLQYREEIRHQIMTLFFAGYETTNTALAWTWYLIAQHPEIEQQLFEETQRVIGDRDIAYDDLRQLPYAGQVIAEALRLYPPVYTLPRKAATTDTLDHVHIHQGDNVLLAIHALHRMSDYWDDPDEFRPERFAPENLTKAQRDAYMPFGAGQRKCIGVNFATVEMVVVTCMLARQFRFRVSPEHPVITGAAVTIFPQTGIHMILEER